jgi:hypothetical protein
MDANQKQWNLNQQKLRRALGSRNHKTAIHLFLSQHAMVHSAKMARTNLWSYEDEIFENAAEDIIRRIPPGGEHSIAWILLHIARIEDMTMNILVAGTLQLFSSDHWEKKLKISILHSANKMSDANIADLSAQIDMDALRAYRLAVGRRTREIVQKLKPEDFKQKVASSRIQKILDAKAVSEGAIEIVNYWSKRTIAGLLLMPPTRHNFLHLNEASRIKQKLQR